MLVTPEDPWPTAVVVNKMSWQQRGANCAFVPTMQCLIALTVLGAALGACVWSYLNCLPCLFGVFMLCACFCCYIPYLNIPLWFSLLLLIILGWNFTTGHFIFTWTGAI